MNMIRQHRLVLHPIDPDQAVKDVIWLKTVLHDTGLTGTMLHGEDADYYRAGSAFLELISFLGCSPSVMTEPPDIDVSHDVEFCHIEIAEPLSVPEFLGAENVRAPSCPVCRLHLNEWRSMLARWENDHSRGMVCPGCGHEAPLHALNWHQSAGFARVWVNVWGIHEGEAVPGDRLLGILGDRTGGPWGYFYACSLRRRT